MTVWLPVMAWLLDAPQAGACVCVLKRLGCGTGLGGESEAEEGGWEEATWGLVRGVRKEQI